MPAAAVRTNARSAPSSTCRGGSRGAARRTTSRRSCAPTSAQGLRSFFITDDNFARNKDWEAILDRLIHLREVEKLDIGFIIQVDTLCHKLPNFIDKCARAGVKQVYHRAGEHQSGQSAGGQEEAEQDHRIPQDAAGLEEGGHPHLCRLHHRLPERHRRDRSCNDIEVIKRELPVDLLEILLPHAAARIGGSPEAVPRRRAGSIPTSTNTTSTTSPPTHPQHAREEWEHAYRKAWKRYYTDEHSETVMRRAAALRHSSNALFLITWFKGSIEIENIHPLESGFMRLKFRRDRRPTLPIEPVWRSIRNTSSSWR